jgi:hypothetical protein
MPVDQKAPRLVHYTASAQVIDSILRYGFLLVPNKRHLINALLGEELFSEREPQEFGMVSFTQLPLEQTAAHKEKFGPFGIVVSWEWALSNDAQRVIYLDESGPVAQTFAWLFRLAKQELDRATNGDPGEMMLTNKALAFTAASTMYARLLTLYEYMEPERNSAQVEWRVANKVPQYHHGTPRAELVDELLRTAKLWKNFGSVRVEPNDICALICPRAKKKELTKLIPVEFGDVPVLTYRPPTKFTRLLRARDRALSAHRGRERIITVEKAPPDGVVWLRTSSNGAYRLPEVGRVWGAGLYQDELISGIRSMIQYQSTTGFLCELVLPILDALYLLNLLKAMQHDGGLDSLNPSNNAGR